MSAHNFGEIDQESPVPLYHQIYDIILGKIGAREFLPHQQIPSEDELASVFEVSRMTVRQAILKLLNEGRIYRKRGRGTFIAEPKIERKVAKLTSFAADMEEAGLRPDSTVLEQRVTRPAEDARRILKLKKRESVVEIVRLRLANDQPIAVARSVIPVKICPYLTQEKLERVLSLTVFLEEKCAQRIGYAEQKIQAVDADAYVSKLLGVRKGTSLLHLNRIFHSVDHAPLGIFESFYRGDRYVFISTLYR